MSEYCFLEKACTRTRASQRPVRWEVIRAKKTSAQDESRVVKKSKARGGSSNQSLLKRKTIPLDPHGGKQGTARVIRHCEVADRCVLEMCHQKNCGRGERECHDAIKRWQ